MESKKIRGKNLVRLLIGFSILAILSILYLQRLPDGKLHLIFCNVGQGDAILVITPLGDQILIDGGPDNSVLSCLGKKIPFYDRKLELVILTHPQLDHMTGLVSVFKSYQVEKVLKTNAINNTAEFEAFEKSLEEEKSQEFLARSGTKIHFGSPTKELTGEILWPKQDQFTPLLELNDTSIVLRLNFGPPASGFCVFLTGDATNNVWLQLLAQGGLSDCFLLKAAHHGSKNATSPQFLSAVSPKIAVISAGKNNRYGHPHEEVLEGLRERGIKILRTDIDGTIEIITDGKKVEIKD